MPNNSQSDKEKGEEKQSEKKKKYKILGIWEINSCDFNMLEY